MVRRKLDNRIRTIIDNAVIEGHRNLFVIVGEKCREQVGYIHHMMSRASLKQIEVLWCYRDKLMLSSNKIKRAHQIKKLREADPDFCDDDNPYETFVSTTNIRYTYYRNTHKILGNTFKMCVLQDFEGLTPNILCRTIETVEGGGAVIIFLQSVTSLKQLFTLNMDVHARYRTESHQHIVPRFNERFILSLASCTNCIVMDDQMRVLPISSHIRDIQPLPPRDASSILTPAEVELKELKDSTKGTQPLGTLIHLCKSLDQAKVLLEFIMLITEKTLNTTVTLTAARGRGKSAAMGIALAGAIAFGYSNIYVTSPAPQNLMTLFEFIIKGLKALHYEELNDYNVLRSDDPEHDKATLRITVTRDHQQVIQYISPSECDVLGAAELVVIDEAAAIPLPLVKSLLGPYLVFVSSTVCGYEGTGRSLSLKLFKQLRDQSQAPNTDGEKSRKLVELGLQEPIRYKIGDKIEKWLFDLLCLDTKVPVVKNVPPPEECELFYVNKDTLFGYHKVSEKVLNGTMGLLVSSHYKNSPDDLQILSDAPAHHLFVLLPKMTGTTLPPVLVVIQVALEGKISKKSISQQKIGAIDPSGDLIPWVMHASFLNEDFPLLSGARVVRVATHPELQRKGYGTRALTLLASYYEKSCAEAGSESSCEMEVDTQVAVIDDNEVGLLQEKIEPRGLSKPLFYSLDERKAEALHYLGVSYGASSNLMKLWKKLGYTPVIFRETTNRLTGEHNVLMLKVLGECKQERSTSWLHSFFLDFRKRFISLLPGPFRQLDSSFALSLVTSKIYKSKATMPNSHQINWYLNQALLHRLKAFSNQQIELTLIEDVWSPIAILYFLDMIPNLKLTALQMTVLLGIGLQRKHPTAIANEFGLETSKIMSLIYEMSQEIYKAIVKAWNHNNNHSENCDEVCSNGESLTMKKRTKSSKTAHKSKQLKAS